MIKLNIKQLAYHLLRILMQNLTVHFIIRRQKIHDNVNKERSIK